MGIFDSIGGFFSNAWDNVKHIASNIASIPSNVSHIISNTFTSAKQSVQHIVQSGLDAGKAVVNKAIDLGKGIANKTVEIGQAIGQKAESVITTLHDDAKAYVSGVGSLVSTPLIVLAGGCGLAAVAYAYAESQKR
jgi:phage-related protein